MLGLEKLGERRKQKIKNKELEKSKVSGIYIENPPEIKDNKRLFFVLVNGLLNFMVVAGAVGSFMTAFEINCYLIPIIIASGVIALILAAIYFNTFCKISIYIVSFLSFLYIVINRGLLIRAGFAHICNKMMIFLEDELDLPIERSYDVYGYDEKISVTLSVIFIMFCVMLMFNLAISESKGFVVVFLFTFPIVQIGLYFDRKINIFFFMLYMVGLVCLALLRNSSHFKMEYKKRKGYKSKKHKNTITYNYTNDGKHTLSYVISMAIIMFSVALVVGMISSQEDYSQDEDKSEWKYNTRNFVREFAIVGFWGMVNPNGKSAGGVSRNKMGDSKYVSLDYRTDLIVHMPVTEEDTDLYLKSFYGTYYDDGYWYISSEKENAPKPEDYGIDTKSAYSLPFEMKYKYLTNDISGYFKDIEVINVGANPDYYYIPYDTIGLFEDENYSEFDDEIKGGLDYNWKTLNHVYTLNKIMDIDEFKDKISEIKDKKSYKYTYKEEGKYSEYVKEAYMDVPKENIESIKRFCNEYGITEDSKDIVQKVKDAFLTDYEYTLIPGRTPKNKDFVNYFLDKQKKGYCAYFATASTLIFRYLGIPARYTGGYVLFKGDYSEGSIYSDVTIYSDGSGNSGNIEEWVKPTPFYDESDYTGIYEFELTDANAHAWVEIYIDGYGWLPVDTTPPIDEEVLEDEKQENTNNLVNYLTSNIFTPENFNRVKDTTTRLIIVLIAGSIIVVCGFILIGFAVRKHRRNSDDVVKLYENMCRAAKAVKLVKKKEETFDCFGRRIVDAGLIEDSVMIKINEIVEKQKYSGRKASREEVLFVQKNVDMYIENIYGKIFWMKKFIYKYIKWI